MLRERLPRHSSNEEAARGLINVQTAKPVKCEPRLARQKILFLPLYTSREFTRANELLNRFDSIRHGNYKFARKFSVVNSALTA